MGDFKTELVRDAARMVSSREFGERITYLADQDEPRVIDGLVDREQVEPASAGQAGASYGRLRYRLTVVNDAILGVTEIRVGKDRVFCKAHLGDAEDTEFVVSAVVEEDPGAWHLELTK